MNDRALLDFLAGEGGMPGLPPAAPRLRTDLPLLHVALVAGNGGEDFGSAASLAEDLRLLGQRVQLIRPRRHKWEQPAPAERLQEVLLPLHPSPARLVYHWRQHTPDLVHILDTGYLGWAATHTARQMGLPVSVGCEAPLPPPPTAARWQQKLAQGWKHHIYRNAHLLLAEHAGELRELRQSGLHHGRVVPRGIDLAHWHPRQRSLSLRRQWGVRSDTPVLAHLGPVDETAVDALRSAMTALTRHHPDARLLLLEAGRIPNRLQALLPLRGEDWREVPPGRPGHERKPSLAALLASADILLVAHPEARPQLIPHALACGLAVVARDGELGRTFIEDDHNGFLVPPGDKDGYKAAIDALARRADIVTRLRLRAPASVAGYGRSIAADRMIRVFKETVQGHRRCQRAANSLVIAVD